MTNDLPILATFSYIGGHPIFISFIIGNPCVVEEIEKEFNEPESLDFFKRGEGDYFCSLQYDPGDENNRGYWLASLIKFQRLNLDEEAPYLANMQRMKKKV